MIAITEQLQKLNERLIIINPNNATLPEVGNGPGIGIRRLLGLNNPLELCQPSDSHISDDDEKVIVIKITKGEHMEPDEDDDLFLNKDDSTVEPEPAESEESN